MPNSPTSDLGPNVSSIRSQGVYAPVPWQEEPTSYAGNGDRRPAESVRQGDLAWKPLLEGPVDLLIREATETDLPGVLRIYAQPELDAGKVLSLEEALARFERFSSYPCYRLYVAEVDGTVVGTFALLIMDNLAHCGAPSGIVEDVGVLPEHQGRGVGRLMMHRARELCAEAGCYKLTLSSNLRRTEAHAFYESLGFHKHGYSFLVEPGET